MRANRQYLIQGDLGTAGYVETNAGGEPVRFKPLALETLDHLASCDTLGARYACVAVRYLDYEVGRRVLVHDGHALNELLDLPPKIVPTAVHLFGEEGIAVGDDVYELYARVADSEPWQVHEASSGRGEYRFRDRGDGFFTWFDSRRVILTFTNNETGRIEAITLPREIDNNQSRLLAVVDGTLLIGPGRKGEASNMYSVDSDLELAQVDLPEETCDALSVSGSELTLSCAGGRYRSGNLGEFWQRL
jgi:hypothetical protein